MCLIICWTIVFIKQHRRRKLFFGEDFMNDLFDHSWIVNSRTRSNMVIRLISPIYWKYLYFVQHVAGSHCIITLSGGEFQKFIAISWAHLTLTRILSRNCIKSDQIVIKWGFTANQGQIKSFFSGDLQIFAVIPRSMHSEGKLIEMLVKINECYKKCTGRQY